MNKNAFFVLSAIAFLIITIVFYLTIDSLRIHKTPIRNNHLEFQRLLHGVGIGATTKPAWCFINFDPRIDPRCTCIEWPIPGGYCYCPDHTGTVSFISDMIEMGVAVEILK
ncbi:hypothetical protein KsCSTR_41240 [Candidatus Kuenenia stuttgartiensis]|jgi:hypothetical protein|uniref:Uncharacterized protein n=1 Tax=Kuenenia stuttgartiensis TaxID=174633 RepID=Q1Q7F1_KUEST|nr:MULTISPECIES: hypothetical protein [Kuenenia]MBW7941842.1 hypothetical protein [Candidatus Kuenenia stuttgartiensis]MBZ0192216.1 hypothetical protein [Candidatus Kuenenia stuttgartiensis]MCF6151518.1 hypothetical protein [Candidatus Kuenenia stuttgartiensis]MCL4726684.1 hypothetical protein [Candidatus Kuenenia stuttgartiensis]MCZ7622583.1 hypothetical protein [Candidatus Kuenenia sp.]